ncbi:MAG: glycosyltransferase family 4 protein [Candidatus Methanofastidiosa archaeon]|nr:glycosyltransferase family 4 protein [Candidatus Methanofastidiosa archaeon]
MKEVDILAEQFIATGYALNAIEGMASGLPVLSNLDNEFYTRLFRRYCYLNECPILSTTPETLKDNLRVLIKNPQLRKELGEAGRKYVEKYHSYEAAQYIFGSIYKKILDNEDIDLMNLFHPLKSEYNKRKPYVNHPLTENKLPKEYYEKC